MARLIADIVAWAEAADSSNPQHETAEALRQRCAALFPAMDDGAVDWPSLLTVSILTRLDELVLALQDSRELARLIGGSTQAATARVVALLRVPKRRRLHLDHGMAALSGVSLMAAVMACCAIWIGAGWPDGAIAAMSAAVFSSFFAILDDPAPAIVRLLSWLLLSLPFAALYLFAILPGIDGFPMLVLVLAPAMLWIGYLQARPRWVMPGMALLIGFAGALALQSSFSADLPEFVNANLAQVVGVALALAFTRLLRSVGAGWAARRILKSGWQDVSALARRRQAVDQDSWISAMLDRVGLVSARVALAGAEDALDAHDALADLRAGLNVLHLRQAADQLGPGHTGPIDAALAAVAQTFDARVADKPPADHPALLGAIDRAIDDLAVQPGGPATLRGFAALTGLRRNLCPDAPAYRPNQARAA